MFHLIKGKSSYPLLTSETIWDNWLILRLGQNWDLIHMLRKTLLKNPESTMTNLKSETTFLVDGWKVEPTQNTNSPLDEFQSMECL